MRRFSVWNLYAKAYDVINQNVPYLKMLDTVIQEAEIQGTMKILDAGCGTGNLLKKMSIAFPDSQYVGVDSSKEMLRRAQKKFPSNRDVVLQNANLDADLPYPSGSFDRVVSVNTLYALRDPKHCIAELYRILKPRGNLVFTNPHDTSTFSGIMREQMLELGAVKFVIAFLRNLPPLLVIIFVNVFFLRRNNNYWSQKETGAVLRRVGFTNIQTDLTYANQAFLVSATK